MKLLRNCVLGLVLGLFPALQAGAPPETFLDPYLHPADKRYDSFYEALQLMTDRNATTVIETGTARGGMGNFGGDGGSTVLFSLWAKEYGADFYSVDIDPRAVEHAERAVNQVAGKAKLVCGDSISFLERFPGTIDMLYLDSYDFECHNPRPSQEHHLKEIIAAYPKLTPDSIVMVDDCKLPHGGKCSLVIDYLRERGWEIVYDGYQVILLYN
jgi:SAM-dependent methyltransferase